jgi:two-component system, NtrC family, nitrogen regulation sensor histidine kinase NtrY
MAVVSLARLRDLSLKGKVTLTLTAVFASIAGFFLLALLPFLADQRQRLLEQDKRLLLTLRDNYQRQFIYDLLSENQESLAVTAADLARQQGISWVRIVAERVDLKVTADRAWIRRLIGDEPALMVRPDEPLVLLVTQEGHADVLGMDGRLVIQGRPVPREAVPSLEAAAGPAAWFEERHAGGEPMLFFTAALEAAGDQYGRLHVLYSLAVVSRAEALTRFTFFGLAGTTFVLLLLLLNVFISRMVIAPVQRVLQAMSQAARGQLETRLPVHSRDEIGAIAGSFNRMVEELATSKHEIEDYSRNLEARVEERTRELRESEAKLLAVKNRLATVIANVATGVISLDESGRITTFNDRAAEILSVMARPLEGQRLEQVLGEGEGQQLLELVAAVQEGRTAISKAQINCRLPRGRRTLSVVVSSLHGEGRSDGGVVVVLDDLTQLLASQRLETWKEAVEKVIHEIKNPLTPVGLAAQTLQAAHARDRHKFDEIFPSAIEMILRAVRDLKELISDFTRFSRLPKIVLQRSELNPLVEEALTPYAHGSIEGVRVTSRLAAGLPPVEADADQLKRVLLNVINNGIEAMDQAGGELLVTTFHDAVSRQVVVAVCDSGAGIEDVERIFEPHYTTKVKGTGLGLAIARQIVEEHGGEIRIASQLGVGTTVEIRLPAAPQ